MLEGNHTEFAEHSCQNIHKFNMVQARINIALLMNSSSFNSASWEEVDKNRFINFD